IEQALQQIIAESENIDIVLGYPEMEKNKIFNACSVLRAGSIMATYYKQKLPNYSVFDEKRYFEPGKEICIFDLKGIPTALSICEDIWEPEPCAKAKANGAKLMININASPYHLKKSNQRKRILEQRVTETGLNIIYVNLVGGQDELVFDGNSMVVNDQGEVIFHAPQFEEELFNINLDLKKQNKKIDLFYPGEEESIYSALVLGVRDYIRKNKFKGAIIGLSGGIDSALTLCIAVDAIGSENVEVLIMPSRYTAEMSIEDACEQAKNLNVVHEIISIEKPFNSFLGVLESRFKDLPTDLTEENIQARCRGLLLMAVSNKTGKIVLTTGNKSEMAVGYATLYGDMAGGFAPLKDIWKTTVYKLAKWRNKKQHTIPERVISRPPSAELRPDQVDQDSLPEYDVLDPILENYIEKDHHPEETIARGYDADTVYKVVNLVDKNEYKRRQAAPGVRITERAFGRDRRYPITSGYVEKK
ncbi:MAG: NAD+ synthase, partial [Proteobacteria bacterium]|nr:NAD+ synthase [Pseudomonadota bacterium]